MNEITYDSNVKIDKWVYEESELKKAFRERKEYKEKCEYLQSKIDKVNKILNANTHVENIYHALCNLFDEEYQYEIDNEELNDILKGDK